MNTSIRRTFRIDQTLFYKFKSYIAQQRIPSYSIVLVTLIEQYLKNPTTINAIIKLSKSRKTTPEEAESSSKE